MYKVTSSHVYDISDHAFPRGLHILRGVELRLKVNEIKDQQPLSSPELPRKKAAPAQSSSVAQFPNFVYPLG